MTIQYKTVHRLLENLGLICSIDTPSLWHLIKMLITAFMRLLFLAMHEIMILKVQCAQVSVNLRGPDWFREIVWFQIHHCASREGDCRFSICFQLASSIDLERYSIVTQLQVHVGNTHFTLLAFFWIVAYSKLVPATTQQDCSFFLKTHRSFCPIIGIIAASLWVVSTECEVEFCQIK